MLINNSPDITSASLLANKIVLPARAAAKVEGRPAAPTIAAITQSTSDRVTICSKPWLFLSNSGGCSKVDKL